jgi:hypothetical protein
VNARPAVHSKLVRLLVSRIEDRRWTTYGYRGTTCGLPAPDGDNHRLLQGKPRVSRRFAHTRLCITARHAPVELGNYFVVPAVLRLFLVGDDLDRHEGVHLFVKVDLDRKGSEPA